MNFSLGDVVVNLSSQVARVVGYHADTREPILRAFGRDGKLRGGKWLADPAKTRLLTDDEVRAFGNGATITR